MIKVKISLDKLTSLLACYHILCASTGRNMKHNPEVFENLNVSSKEKEDYRNWLLKIGIPLDKSDLLRTKLFFPESKTLDKYFDNSEEVIPDELKRNMKSFEKRFIPYLKKIKEKIGMFVKSRSRESNKLINKIYNLAQEFSGIEIERPKELEVRIVGGFSPSSRGTKVKDGKGYIVMQVCNFLSEGDSYLMTLIHESIAHKVAIAAREYYKELFGKFIYDIEEGFAKLFSRKIAENILGRAVNYHASKGIQEQSYKTFDKNWNLLDGKNFKSWYKNCLTEIKRDI